VREPQEDTMSKQGASDELVLADSDSDEVLAKEKRIPYINPDRVSTGGPQRVSWFSKSLLL